MSLPGPRCCSAVVDPYAVVGPNSNWTPAGAPCVLTVALTCRRRLGDAVAAPVAGRVGRHSACASSFASSVPPSVNRKNGVPWRAALAGRAVARERIRRARRRDRRADVGRDRRAGRAVVARRSCPALTRWPYSALPPAVPADVRRVAGERDVRRASPCAIGWPPLAMTKRAAAPAPTRRETKTSLSSGLPPAGPSSHTTHGTVGLPAVIVPAATRESSASASGFAFSEQPASAAAFAPHGPAAGGVVEHALAAVADRRPVEAAVDGARRGRRPGRGGLRGEDHLVVVQLARARRLRRRSARTRRPTARSRWAR